MEQLSMEKRKKESIPFSWQLFGGIGFTFIIALIGIGLSKITGFNLIGPLACSIIIAVIYRQVWSYPETIRKGIEFSSKKLLRLAIILYGLKLNIDVLINQGMPLLLRGLFTIILAILVTMVIAKWLKADFSLSFILAIGTGVCGAAAIAAVSPILKTKEEDTAIGVGIIALIGTLFAVVYTVLRPIIPLTGLEYGVWSGVSLHEIAHVALAAAPANQDVMTIALLAKLSRVLLLVPLCYLLLFWINSRKTNSTSKTKIEFPWFLIGFILMSLFNSYILGNYIIISESILNGMAVLTTLILTMAMVGLGLNVSLHAIRSKALRPLIVISITSILLSCITFFTL